MFNNMNVNSSFDLWVNRPLSTIQTECENNCFSQATLDVGIDLLCKHGRLDEAKWLMAFERKNSDNDDNVYTAKPTIETLYKAIENGHFMVVKWLFPLVLQTQEDYLQLTVLHNAFFTACVFGHFEIAKYLYEFEGYETIRKKAPDATKQKSLKDILEKQFKLRPTGNENMKEWAATILCI